MSVFMYICMYLRVNICVYLCAYIKINVYVIYVTLSAGPLQNISFIRIIFAGLVHIVYKSRVFNFVIFSIVTKVKEI